MPKFALCDQLVDPNAGKLGVLCPLFSRDDRVYIQVIDRNLVVRAFHQIDADVGIMTVEPQETIVLGIGENAILAARSPNLNIIIAEIRTLIPEFNELNELDAIEPSMRELLFELSVIDNAEINSFSANDVKISSEVIDGGLQASRFLRIYNTDKFEPTIDENFLGKKILNPFDKSSKPLSANEGFDLENFLTPFSYQSVLDISPSYIWIWDENHKIIWVNTAYINFVGVQNRDEIIDQQQELIDKHSKDKLLAELTLSGTVSRGVPTVINGVRRLIDITLSRAGSGVLAFGTDRSDFLDIQNKLNQTIENHSGTLDKLTTAVAIFDSSKHLQFYNTAFQNLWDFDPAFLDLKPDHSTVLNNLRTARKLPEQSDWQRWKDDLFEVYQSVDPVEHWWYLPDGQTLRVIANPHPHHGVTWVFENITEELDLKSRYNALIQVQGETLDHLSEAVAVFAPDGTLRLSNPTFQKMWQLSDEDLGENAHISKITKLCASRIEAPQSWENLQTTITGLDDGRGDLKGRMKLLSGRHVDYALMPLPNGQSMLTFVDVSASVEVENVLVDRNTALEQADDLKNAFIEHVSYELRSPVTNIIGFSELLGSPEFGQLNIKQGEYLDHINSSSSSLLALINNVLDLATVDAGIIELELNEIDIPAMIDAARDGVLDQMRERNISLNVEISQLAGPLIGDENKIRQVLFNLLSNAVAWSSDGDEVLLSCAGNAENVAFSVTDYGNGLPKEVSDTVFNRFESHSTAHKRGGAGLGLAIVKSFVELHGGTTELHSTRGKGTTVTCHIPIKPFEEGTRQSARAKA